MKRPTIQSLLVILTSCAFLGCAADPADPADDASADEDSVASESEQAFTTSGTLVVQQSILGIKFRDTRTQVRAVLGAPTYVENAPDLATGQPTKTFHYAKLKTDVMFMPGDAPGVWRVMYVNTTMGRDKLKTPDGIGVGSTLRQLKAKYPQVECSVYADYRECSIGKPLEKRTTFGFGHAAPSGDDKIESLFFGFIPD